MQHVARSQDYNVFLCNTDESAEQELQVLYSLAAQPVDGIVLFGSRISDQDLVAFADYFHPLVVLNCHLELPGVGSIQVDNFRGADLAVGHLADQGHEAIGMLAGPVASPSGAQRVQGFRKAMQSRSLEINEEHIVPCAPTLDGGYEAARHLWNQYPAVTGVFVYNDLAALGAVNLCNDVGRKVPSSCAVIGFDDIRLASMVRPSLSTIHVDQYELGRKAMTMLLGMFDDTAMSLPAESIDVELVVREST